MRAVIVDLSDRDYEPLCDETGICTACFTEGAVSICIYCGTSMHKKGEFWFHHDSDQYEDPKPHLAETREAMLLRSGLLMKGL